MDRRCLRCEEVFFILTQTLIQIFLECQYDLNRDSNSILKFIFFTDEMKIVSQKNPYILIKKISKSWLNIISSVGWHFTVSWFKKKRYLYKFLLNRDNLFHSLFKTSRPVSFNSLHPYIYGSIYFYIKKIHKNSYPDWHRINLFYLFKFIGVAP